MAELVRLMSNGVLLSVRYVSMVDELESTAPEALVFQAVLDENSAPLYVCWFQVAAEPPEEGALWRARLRSSAWKLSPLAAPVCTRYSSSAVRPPPSIVAGTLSCAHVL